MIAMALSCDPELLIADEPTTALDVTVQAQILRPDRRAAGASSGTAVILITHDLGVVAEVAEKILVMYAGRVDRAGPRRAGVQRARSTRTPGACCSSVTAPGPGPAANGSQPSPVCRPSLTTCPSGCPSVRAARTRA